MERYILVILLDTHVLTPFLSLPIFFHFIKPCFLFLLALVSLKCFMFFCIWFSVLFSFSTAVAHIKLTIKFSVPGSCKASELPTVISPKAVVLLDFINQAESDYISICIQVLQVTKRYCEAQKGFINPPSFLFHSTLTQWSHSVIPIGYMYESMFCWLIWLTGFKLTPRSLWNASSFSVFSCKISSL